MSWFLLPPLGEGSRPRQCRDEGAGPGGAAGPGLRTATWRRGRLRSLAGPAPAEGPCRQPGRAPRRLPSRAHTIWLVRARPSCRCSGLELSCFCVLIAERWLERRFPHILCLLTISVYSKQTSVVLANPLVKWEGNRALRERAGGARDEAEPRGRCAPRSGLRAGGHGGPGGLVAPPGVARAVFLWASSTSVLPLPTTGPRGDSPRHCDSRCFLGHRVSASRALPAPSCDTACFPLLAVTPDSPPPVSERWEPPGCLSAASSCRKKGPKHVNKHAITRSVQRQAE